MILGVPTRAVRTGLVAALVVLSLAPITGLPYSADDTLNRNWPVLGISNAVREAWRLNNSWMYEQGRFFPGGWIYGLAMWNVMDSRAAYMTYLVLLSLTLVALVALVIWSLTGSALLTVLGVLALSACFQIRFGFLDGIASFGGLVAYTLVLTMTSGLCAARILRGGSRWLAAPLVLAWGLAITAYEVSLLMLPAVLALVWVSAPSRCPRSRWAWALVPLLALGALQLGVTLLLRAAPNLPLAPAYQIDLGGPVGTTFLKQLTAALPFSQQGWAGAPINATLSVMLVLVIALPIVLAWRPWATTPARVATRVHVTLMLAGTWAWIVPSTLAGVTRRWQAELPWGQGYVYLAYEFVGLSLLIVGLSGLLWSRLQSPWGRAAFGAIFVIFAVAAAVTAGVNITNLGTIVPGPQGPG